MQRLPVSRSLTGALLSLVTPVALVALFGFAPAGAQAPPSASPHASVSGPSSGSMCSQAGGQSALDLPMETRATGQLSYSIAVGQSFAFTVPYSGGTGYSWSVLKRPNPRVAEAIGIWTVGGVDRPGGPGRAIVVSRGTGAGTTAFSVGYSRPWEHGVAPVKTVTVQVRVAKAPAGC